MKITTKILVILITCLSINTYCQKLDSLILKGSTTEVENPKMSSLDSLHTNLNKTLNNLYDKEMSVSTAEYKAPVFFFIDGAGKEVSINEYFYNELKKVSTKFKAYFQIEVDWNGQINFVKLQTYQGNIDKVDFINLWKGINEIPATDFGIPVRTMVTIPIVKN